MCSAHPGGLCNIRSIEPHNFISSPIDEIREILAEFSGQADEPQQRAVAEVAAPLGIEGPAVFPHLLQRRVRLRAPVQAGKHNGDAEHHEQLML